MRLSSRARLALPVARDWLRANAPYPPNIVAFMSDREVIEDIEKYFAGGWQNFEES